MHAHLQVSMFEAAWALRLPMLLKGPTGCGKTRLVESMAYRLGQPLVTIACHEDSTAADLVGRYLLDAEVGEPGVDLARARRPR